MEKPIVHAIVGCGRIAPCHVDAFARLPNVRIKYACASDLQQAATFAVANGISSAASFECILDDDEVTSLSIATPHDLHAGMAEEAIRRGKHVLVEKPAAIRVADLDRLLGMANHPGQPVLMPVSQHRFDAPIRAVAQLLFDGLLGPIQLVRAHLECFRPPEYYTESDWRGKWEREGGSVLINQAYHILDLVTWLGGEVSTVSAEMRHQLYGQMIETEETLTATFGFSHGALGSLSVCGSAGSRWHSSIDIVGRTGSIGFNIGFPPAVYRTDLQDRKAAIAIRQTLKRLAETSVLAPPGLDYYGTAHREQAAAFVALIRQGVRDPFAADLVHARRVVELASRCYESARAGMLEVHRHV